LSTGPRGSVIRHIMQFARGHRVRTSVWVLVLILRLVVVVIVMRRGEGFGAPVEG
jgi:hypothetical protein